MKKIYQEPSLECCRIYAENVMNNTGIDGGQQGVVTASGFTEE